MVHSPPGETRRRRRRRCRRYGAALLAVVALAAPLAAIASADAGAAEAADPLAEEIARGYELLERRLTAEAVSAFRGADEAAGGASVEALIGLARAYLQLGASSTAEKTARRAVAAAAGDPALRALAEDTLRLVLGEAGAEGDGTGAGAAAYSMVTLDGRSLSPEHFLGRAVLLDFWGTWCPPCRKATPELRRLAGELDGEPFELVGVSSEPKGDLEVYVAKHDMDWTQVWDRGGKLTRGHFGVGNFPTYVLLDHEGREVYRISGWSDGIRRRLERKVRAAVLEARNAEERSGG